MRGRFRDLTGRKFGRLCPVSFYIKNKRTIWKCQCDCGKLSYVRADSLLSGVQVSCGCHKKDVQRERRTIHGRYNTKEHVIWRSMKNRCNKPNHKKYHLYGGKGISYCKEWEEFNNFIEDMGCAPEGCSIDRIDGNKGYYPKNCRWATSTQQARNRPGLRMYKDKCLAEWAEKIGLSPNTLYHRVVKANWPWERALTTPVKEK